MTPTPIKHGRLADFLEEQDITSLIRLNVFLFIGLAAVALTGYLIVRNEGWAHFARNAVLLILGSLLIALLLNRKMISLAAYSSLLIYAIVLFYTAWTGAGVKGTTYSLFVLIVVGAALAMGRQAGYLTALLGTAFGLVLLLAGRAGLLVNINRPIVDIATWVTLSVCFLIAAHMVSLVIRQTERAFARAQTELDERIRAEMEVRRLNSELEQRVMERTSQLAAREAFLSGIFDAAGDAIITMDKEQKILSFGKSAERVFGYAAAEVIGQSLDILLPAKHVKAHTKHVRGFGESADVARFMGMRREVYGRRKDGTEFPAEASISKMMFDGKLIFSAFVWDVSERKRLERALGEEEHRFRRVFDVSPVAIVITTLAEGRLIDANDAYWKLSGHDPQLSVGKTTSKLIPGFDPKQHQDLVNLLIDKKSLKNTDYIFVDKYGNHRSTMAFRELIDLEGQPAILSMFYDMTEQVEAQQALQRSEGRLRGLLKAIPETIFEIQRDGTILQYMPSSEVTMLTTEDLAGQSMQQVMPASVAAQIMFAAERTLASGQLHTIEYQLPQYGRGTTFETRVTVSGADSVMLMVRDVSLHRRLEIEREQMIDALEKRNAESESLRETTVIVTSTLDISETVQRILHQLKRVIDYDTASVWLYTGSMTHLVGGIGIPEMPEADKHYEVGENEPDYPLWVQDLPYILLDDVQQNYPQFRQPPINYIHGWLGVPLKVHGKLIGIISLDSQKVGHFTHEDATLALNYANQVSIAVENARLFSDLQHELNERQKLIDELDSKNSELELFTYSVSHDLKSPLFTIRGFLGFLEEDIAAGNISRVENDVRRISDAMNVMQERLDDLLELSRAGRLTNEREVIRFNDLAAEALELVHGRITEGNVTVIVEGDLPSIYGDRHRLLEVLQNLIENAAKFMGEQKNPVIEISQRGEEDGKPLFFIRDNGIGIPFEHHGRIFGIFNKLNPNAEGTGIGLSIVKRIIEAHGGRIWLESEPAVGSTFYFSLPREAQA